MLRIEVVKIEVLKIDVENFKEIVFSLGKFILNKVFWSEVLVNT